MFVRLLAGVTAGASNRQHVATIVRILIAVASMAVGSGCGGASSPQCGNCDASIGDHDSAAETHVASDAQTDANPDESNADSEDRGDGSGEGSHDAGVEDGPQQQDAGADGPPDAANDSVQAADAGQPTDGSAWRRDWTRNPPVFAQTSASRLWGLSDVHGDRDRLIALLGAAGLVGGSASSPTWTGGTDTLVVSGDSIDKGPQSVEVLDAWMALAPQADASGGHLVVLLGNHEVEFLADPLNSKAAPLVAELGGLSPVVFASPDDPHGRFLRERPIAALVDGWFFSHAGNSGGQTADEIGARFKVLADANAWSDLYFLDPNSLLEARSWWPTLDTATFLDGYLSALPARHFVFGHHPTSFADPPTGNIEVHAEGRLVLVDVGMSRAVNYSTGKLLRVEQPGTAGESVSMLTSVGDAIALDLTVP